MTISLQRVNIIVLSIKLHLVSTPVSGFHMGELTDVEPAHFWSQGPLVNGVRS